MMYHRAIDAWNACNVNWIDGYTFYFLVRVKLCHVTILTGSYDVETERLLNVLVPSMGPR